MQVKERFQPCKLFLLKSLAYGLILLSMVLCGFTLLFSGGLVALASGLLPNQSTPQESANLLTTLVFFVLIAVPVCYFWTKCAIVLWVKLWPKRKCWLIINKT